MTSSRPNQASASFSNRRGHSNKLSISDPSHHVTEAIGTLYDDEEDDSPIEQPLRPGIGSRPLSFMQSPTKSKSADPATSQFPLTNIDNPNDIALELSNLQALRRMSMDVGNNNDPDLLPFSGMSLMAMPSIAPSGGDDEADPSRLLWVPARVHPELAPMEFKRKKSMLSRQIDPSGTSGGVGYVDGAERLGRQASQTGRLTPELTIDELVKDPSKVVQKLTQDSMQEIGPDSSIEDMPILPIAPGGGLRRSTRTTYRKGGSLRGDRLPFSKRIASRQAEADAAGDNSPLPAPGAPLGHGLSRTQSEPVPENFSRPNRSLKRQQNLPQDSLAGSNTTTEATSPTNDSYPDRDAPPDGAAAIPQIVETPPEENITAAHAQRFPQRSSSQKAGAQILPQTQPQHEAAIPEEPPRDQASARAVRDKLRHPPKRPHRKPLPKQQPKPRPGIWALKTRREKEDDANNTAPSKSSWKWFKGDDKKKKDDDHKKSKTKAFVEKAQDNVRLDVIQTSIENAVTKGRESLLIDRESPDNRLDEERKRQSNRKSDSKRRKTMQIPVSPQQRRLEEERRRREQEKQYLAEQQQQQQQQQQQHMQGGHDSIDRYTFDYHRDANQAQYGEAHAADESVDYMDDTHIYDYDEHDDSNDPKNNGNGFSGHDDYGQQPSGDKDYYSYGRQHNGGDGRDGRGGDMW
ncbi:unnamed protein product [Parascedosporium putredinis]|uniref:Uncharacterized protein n=1 Tax=Parascedosporium putredinis TaxID=1442378 RepID=A0A9P1HDE4_9PEZI|nr:unnamed protein product [Parascedosporium putredinis]CAI8004752.1 unnamed protein product [Parascedosporium putredinis]